MFKGWKEKHRWHKRGSFYKNVVRGLKLRETLPLEKNIKITERPFKVEILLKQVSRGSVDCLLGANFIKLINEGEKHLILNNSVNLYTTLGVAFN